MSNLNLPLIFLPWKRYEEMNKEDIARACHEANKALCEAYGDYSQVDYDSAPAWQKKAIMNGVEFHLTGEHGPEETHANWMRDKQKDGWTYGPVKDRKKKTHPCMVPYEKLPTMQKAKDRIIASIVNTLKDQLTA